MTRLNALTEEQEQRLATEAGKIDITPPGSVRSILDRYVEEEAHYEMRVAGTRRGRVIPIRRQSAAASLSALPTAS
jgi:hypothetical protein